MTDPAPRATLDQLLAHRRWVRALALRLAANAADADDLEQDAWLAAVRNPPADTAPRAWLGTVLRNLARTRFRRDERRGRREAAVDVRPPTPSPDDVAAAAELQTRLARAVLDLDEPYRSTVLYRFFEGWDPKEIAERTGVPVDTVRTRLKRAVATLRGRMGRDVDEGSAAWCLLVFGDGAWSRGHPVDLPRAGRSGRAGTDQQVDRLTTGPSAATKTAAVAGGVAMALAKKAAVAAAVLVVLGVGVWQGAAWVAGTKTPDGAPDGAAVVQGTADAPRDAAPHRRARPADVADAATADDAAITVEVTLPGGVPAAGARVEVFAAPVSDDYVAQEVLRGTPPIALARTATDAAGTARIAAPGGDARLVVVARREGFAPAATSIDAKTPAPKTVRLRLGAAFPLAGRVIDGAGAAIPGATVVAERGRFSHAGPVAQRALSVRTKSGDDGAFALAGLAAGPVHLWAARPGGPLVRATVARVPAVDRVDVVLGDDLTPAGVVTDAATGRPLAGATVQTWMGWGLAACAAQATTGADGAWRIDHLPLRSVFVRASCPGYASAQAGDGGNAVELRADGPTRCDVALRRGVPLSGRVLSPDGPVAGADVTAARPARGDIRRDQTKTDAAGRFRFDALPPGETTVVVGAPGWFQQGFPPVWSRAVRDGSAPREATVVVPEEGEATLDVHVTRGLAVAGRVEDADAKPVAGASVSLGYEVSCESLGPWSWQRTKSDADGRFRFGGVAPAASAMLSAHTSDGGSGTVHATLAPDVGADGVIVTIVPPVRITGCVTAPAGIDVADAVVETIAWSGRAADLPPDPWENAAGALVGHDGTYVAKRPASAQVWARAVVPGRAWSEPVSVEFPDGVREAQVDFVLGAALAGRVVDEGGRGVAGARIALGPEGGSMTAPSSTTGVVREVMAVTDADGAFALDPPLPGTWQVTADADGCATAVAHVVAPVAAPLVVTVTRARRLRGRTRFADGRAATGVRIQLVRPGSANDEAVSDAAGAFAFDGVEERAWTLAVLGGGVDGTNVLPRTVSGVVPGDAPVDVVVEPALSIAGRVVDPLGAGVEACHVQIYRDGDGPLANRYAGGAFVGAGGAFEFTGLADGRYVLLASPRRDTTARRFAPVQMPAVAAGAGEVVVRLAEGLVVEGRVVDASGKPVTGLDVDLQSRTPGASDTGTGAWWSGVFRAPLGDDGSFRVDGLPAGTFRVVLVVRNSGSAGTLQVVDRPLVRAGETGLRLVAGDGATIAGRVTGEEGGAWHAPVVATPMGGGEERRVWTADGGAFTLIGLDPSLRYRVRVDQSGLPVARIDDVRPGTLDLHLVMRIGKQASGRLVGTDGAPLAKVTLRFRRADAEHVPTAQTKDDGTFVVIGLLDGAAWDVEAEAPAAAPSWRPCGQVRAGDADAVLRL